MLSGYVMARLLAAKPHSAAQFAWKRYKRFWPTMAVGTALGCIAAFIDGDGPTLMVLVASILLIPSFQGPVFPLNTPMWSIFFELVANSSHPLLNPKLLLVILVISLLVMLTCIAVMNSYSVGHRAFLFGIGRTFLAYSIGAMLYDRWRDKPPFRVPFWVGCALICAPLLTSAPGIFGLFYVVAICPVILAAGLSSGPVWSRFAGDVSFPLYATHVPVLLIALHFAIPPVLVATLAIAVAVLVTWLLKLPFELRRNHTYTAKG